MWSAWWSMNRSVERGARSAKRGTVALRVSRQRPGGADGICNRDADGVTLLVQFAHGAFDQPVFAVKAACAAGDIQQQALGFQADQRAETLGPIGESLQLLQIALRVFFLNDQARLDRQRLGQRHAGANAGLRNMTRAEKDFLFLPSSALRALRSALHDRHRLIPKIGPLVP